MTNDTYNKIDIHISTVYVYVYIYKYVPLCTYIYIHVCSGSMKARNVFVAKMIKIPHVSPGL